jgi:aldehyde dehydrogenase (NAD+)
MLIDGALVDAESGATLANVNRATEDILGQVADASASEMHREEVTEHDLAQVS